MMNHSRLLKVQDQEGIAGDTKGREQDESPHCLFRPSEAACWDVGGAGEPGEASHSSVCQAKGPGLDIQLPAMKAKRVSLRSAAVYHGL